MDWKENIGKKMAVKGLLRFKYLNDNILDPYLNQFVLYLNEFNGIQAKLEKLNFLMDKEAIYARSETRFRLEVFYPNDDILFGKNCDQQNRRFIVDLFFNRHGLNIQVYYRKKNGPFLEQLYFDRKVDPEADIMKEAIKEKDIKRIIKGLSDNHKARDIYYSIMSFDDTINENTLCNHLYYLYEEHIKHINGNKQKE